MGSTARNLLFWVVAALVIFAFWSVSSRIQREERQLSFSDFLTEVEAGRVESVVFRGETIVGDLTSGRAFKTVAPPQAGSELIDTLRSHGVTIHARDENDVSWTGHIISWTPIVVMIAFLIFFMRQAQNPRRRSKGWSEEQRREMKMSILYRLADKGKEVSEDDIVAELIEPGRPTADRVAIEVRQALYEMVSDGTIELTPEKKFRSKSLASQE